MKTYYIQTDAESGEVEAKNLNAAIAEFFAEEGPHAPKNLRELKRFMKKYVADGAWCFIDENDDRVVEIGSNR